MGQYWQVINLDRRETYRGWGKLGEFLFTRLPHRVARSLMMDPPFPDRDSLIFPFKPGAVCEETRKHSTRPLPSTYFPQTASQSSSLTNLPVEMIQRIYFGTDDISDVVCLSVTCQLLWEIGRQEIYARLASSVVKDSWAGDRIVCIGDYLRNDDIPEGLLTPEEVEEFIGLDDEGYERTLYEYPFKAISRHRGNIRIWEDFAQRFYLPDPIFAARLPDWGTYTALQKARRHRIHTSLTCSA
ncbi:hypothetical protein MSAN_02047800 [Mycena sanguinolenta]|uniref:F-box domain-containing protein n=1 Tax=Mycena sanguinolenta TaxID=230812 RepID=A0A8H7CLA8_9AGAR|nr:hypothetical protein MSAN_02047800 [Mycena sanguinolenta]